jgi:transcriptional regulator GlxA family with amidase domain
MQSGQPPIIQAVFIIPPKVHLLDITGPAHIFYEAACYGAPVSLHFSTIFPGQTEAVSSSALSFHRLSSYDQFQLVAGDLVFVPGLDSSLLLTNNFLDTSSLFQNWLKAQHKNGVIICSVCTGAFLLAASGLLDGRECTTHWKFAELFKKKYPKARFQTNRLFVQEDHIYTSAGVSSGIDLALYLTEQLWGAHFAAQVAKEVVIYFRRAIGDPQLSAFTQYRNHLEDRIHTVQDLLTKSLDQKFYIEDLATSVSMSPRNLTRLFKKTTDITIVDYHNRLRAANAERLLHEGHTMKATALHCGLKSTNQLRHLLRKTMAEDRWRMAES